MKWIVLLLLLLVTAGSGIAQIPANSLFVSSAIASAAFTPTPTNMILWLKADAITSYTNNQALTSWVDSSGNNWAINASSGAKPTYVTNLINGLPAVSFNATNNQYFDVIPDMITNTSSAEIFMVLKTRQHPAASSAYCGSWYFAGAAGGGDANFYCYYSTSDGYIFDGFCSTVRQSCSPFPKQLDQWRLFNMSSTNGSWLARLDGTVIGSNSVNTFTISAGVSRTFGMNGHGSASFNGWISEVILYRRITSGTERTDIQNYFATKYGLPIP